MQIFHLRCMINKIETYSITLIQNLQRVFSNAQFPTKEFIGVLMATKSVKCLENIEIAASFAV